MTQKDSHTYLTPQDVKDWKDATEYVRPFAGKKVGDVEGMDELISSVSAPKLPQKRAEESTPKPAGKPREYSYLSLDDSASIDGKLAAKLRAGKIYVDATLDLHGCRQDDALDALVNFIHMANQMGQRCVRIVTGKGKDAPKEYGVLHVNVPRWINITSIRPLVLMYCHPPQREGGEGALLILLKKRR